ncbi:hypothetical protein [Endozoicomonas sp. Mp262]|uniref:hypothetical protein n=1 Tax=Endozoicomonas sp. Mp262 TaxID=2919499 RepID=UPI0021D962B3
MRSGKFLLFLINRYRVFLFLALAPLTVMAMMEGDDEETDSEIKFGVQCSDESEVEYSYLSVAGAICYELHPDEFSRQYTAQNFNRRLSSNFFIQRHQGFSKETATAKMTELPTQTIAARNKRITQVGIEETLSKQLGAITKKTVKQKYPQLYDLLGMEVSCLDHGLAISDLCLRVLNNLAIQISKEEGRVGQNKKRNLKRLFSTYTVQFLAPIKSEKQLLSAALFLVSNTNAITMLSCLDEPMETENIVARDMNGRRLCVQVLMMSMFIFRPYAGEVFIAIMEELLKGGGQLSKLESAPVFFVIVSLARKDVTRKALVSIHDRYPGREEDEERLSVRLKSIDEQSSSKDRLKDLYEILKFQLPKYWGEEADFGIVIDQTVYALRYQRSLQFALHGMSIPGFSKQYSKEKQCEGTDYRQIVEWILLQIASPEVKVEESRKFMSLVALLEYPAMVAYCEKEWKEKRKDRSEVPEYVINMLANCVDPNIKLFGGDRALWHTFFIGILHLQIKMLDTSYDSVVSAPSWLFKLIESQARLGKTSNPAFVANQLYGKMLMKLMDEPAEPSNDESCNKFFMDIAQAVLATDAEYLFSNQWPDNSKSTVVEKDEFQACNAMDNLSLGYQPEVKPELHKGIESEEVVTKGKPVDAEMKKNKVKDSSRSKSKSKQKASAEQKKSSGWSWW